MGRLILIKDHLNLIAAYVGDHVPQFMTTVHSSHGSYFQKDNTPCDKSELVVNWFIEHNNEFQSNKRPLGCSGKGDSNLKCEVNQSRIVGYHNSMDPKLKRVHPENHQTEAKADLTPVLKRVFIIN